MVTESWEHMGEGCPRAQQEEVFKLHFERNCSRNLLLCNEHANPQWLQTTIGYTLSELCESAGLPGGAVGVGGFIWGLLRRGRLQLGLEPFKGSASQGTPNGSITHMPVILSEMTGTAWAEIRPER